MDITYPHLERFDTQFVSVLVIPAVDRKRNWDGKPVSIPTLPIVILPSRQKPDKNKTCKKKPLRMGLMRCLFWRQMPPTDAMLESQPYPLLTSTIVLYSAEYVEHCLFTLLVVQWFLRFFFIFINITFSHTRLLAYNRCSSCLQYAAVAGTNALATEQQRPVSSPSSATSCSLGATPIAEAVSNSSPVTTSLIKLMWPLKKAEYTLWVCWNVCTANTFKFGL